MKSAKRPVPKKPSCASWNRVLCSDSAFPRPAFFRALVAFRGCILPSQRPRRSLSAIAPARRNVAQGGSVAVLRNNFYVARPCGRPGPGPLSLCLLGISRDPSKVPYRKLGLPMPPYHINFLPCVLNKLSHLLVAVRRLVELLRVRSPSDRLVGVVHSVVRVNVHYRQQTRHARLFGVPGA